MRGQIKCTSLLLMFYVKECENNHAEIVFTNGRQVVNMMSRTIDLHKLVFFAYDL